MMLSYVFLPSPRTVFLFMVLYKNICCIYDNFLPNFYNFFMEVSKIMLISQKDKYISKIC